MREGGKTSEGMLYGYQLRNEDLPSLLPNATKCLLSDNKDSCKQIQEGSKEGGRGYAITCLVQARGLAVGGRGRVGVAEQGLDGGEDGRHVIDWAPLVLQDV